MKQDHRPNIMLLQGEDVGLHLHCYPGNEYSHTPNLDQLAREGVRYDQAFTHSPVCAPSRGGMVTGCYPWTIGNHHMRSTLLNPPRTFMHELVDAGYHVSWPTKLDFNFEPGPGWCSDKENWWEQDAPETPFLVYQNFGKTHESQMFGDYEKYRKTHPDLPEQLKHQPAEAPVPPYLHDCPQTREELVKYYDALTDIDRDIGKRLQWLEDQGLAENTIVIFLSDHGRGQTREKRWCYEAGHHMPLIIRWPQALQAAEVSDELIAWVDLAPTLLSLAGIAPPKHLQGQIFLGAEKAAPRDHVLGGRDRMGTCYDCVRMVRDQRWHYIKNYLPELPWAQFQWYAQATDSVPLTQALADAGTLSEAEMVFYRDHKAPEELYDIEADPHCMQNLSEDPAYSEILKRMRGHLQVHHEQYPDLGFLSEEELIEQGLVLDRLSEFRALYDQKREEYQVTRGEEPVSLQDAIRILGKGLSIADE